MNFFKSGSQYNYYTRVNCKLRYLKTILGTFFEKTILGRGPKLGSYGGLNSESRYRFGAGLAPVWRRFGAGLASCSTPSDPPAKKTKTTNSGATSSKKIQTKEFGTTCQPSTYEMSCQTIFSQNCESFGHSHTVPVPSKSYDQVDSRNQLSVLQVNNITSYLY